MTSSKLVIVNERRSTEDPEEAEAEGVAWDREHGGHRGNDTWLTPSLARGLRCGVYPRRDIYMPFIVRLSEARGPPRRCEKAPEKDASGLVSPVFLTGALNTCAVLIPKIPPPIRRVGSHLCRLRPESHGDDRFPKVAHRPGSALKSPGQLHASLGSVNECLVFMML